VILSLGFFSSSHDSALFIKCTDAGHIILSLYVDDMIITGDDIDSISVLKTELARRFKMKDFGYLRYFLGIEVTYSPRGYLLSQSKYVADILERARLTDKKTIDTLIEVNARYSSSDGLPLKDPTLYRTIFWYISPLLIQILHMLFMLLVSLLLLLLLYIDNCSLYFAITSGYSFSESFTFIHLFLELRAYFDADHGCCGGRDIVWQRWRLFVVPPGVRCCVLGRFFGFNHKIMINIHESSPNIMVTRNLWSTRV
jgi:hypothetical protein